MCTGPLISFECHMCHPVCPAFKNKMRNKFKRYMNGKLLLHRPSRDTGRLERTCSSFLVQYLAIITLKVFYPITIRPLTHPISSVFRMLNVGTIILSSRALFFCTVQASTVNTVLYGYAIRSTPYLYTQYSSTNRIIYCMLYDTDCTTR
jgi:hypothetical protein